MKTNKVKYLNTWTIELLLNAEQVSKIIEPLVKHTISNLCEKAKETYGGHIKLEDEFLTSIMFLAHYINLTAKSKVDYMTFDSLCVNISKNLYNHLEIVLEHTNLKHNTRQKMIIKIGSKPFGYQFSSKENSN